MQKKVRKKNIEKLKQSGKMRVREGGEELPKDVFFPPGTHLGAQGPPRWPQGASQDPFFLILGARGCLPGAISQDFWDNLAYILDVFLVGFLPHFCVTGVSHALLPLQWHTVRSQARWRGWAQPSG